MTTRATPATAINRGWTIFGKKYHRVEVWRMGQGRAPLQCNYLLWFDQTERRPDGEPTGALVPTDLRPCKRCFPDGDANA